MDDDELDFLAKMLHYNPNLRITAEESLKHKYFTGEPISEKYVSFGRLISSNKKQHFSYLSDVRYPKRMPKAQSSSIGGGGRMHPEPKNPIVSSYRK